MQSFRTFGDLPPDDAGSSESERPAGMLGYSRPQKLFPWNAIAIYLAIAAIAGMALATVLPSGRLEAAVGVSTLLCAALAIVLSIVGALARPWTNDLRSRASRYLAFILGGLVALVGGASMVPMCSRGPQHAAYCANHLRQIALAAQMYANQDPNRRFPNTPDLILLTQDITSEVFICPASADTPAAGPTTRAVATNLTAVGHLSYVYVGSGLTAEAGSETVLLYELKPMHNDQQNFVYADAHVESHEGAASARIIAELNAGHNPPRADKVR